MNGNIRSQVVNPLIALGMGVGMTLAACQVEGGIPRHGRIELRIDDTEAACLEGTLAGRLLLTNISDGSKTALPAQTLCMSMIRQELPAGLYDVSWSGEPLDETRPRWSVLDSLVLGVLPGCHPSQRSHAAS
jgi:hypothetical protein